eukprot:6180240-Prymnesium_polylepis.1
MATGPAGQPTSPAVSESAAGTLRGARQSRWSVHWRDAAVARAITLQPGIRSQTRRQCALSPCAVPRSVKAASWLAGSGAT